MLIVPERREFCCCRIKSSRSKESHSFQDTDMSHFWRSWRFAWSGRRWCNPLLKAVLSIIDEAVEDFNSRCVDSRDEARLMPLRQGIIGNPILRRKCIEGENKIMHFFGSPKPFTSPFNNHKNWFNTQPNWKSNFLK